MSWLSRGADERLIRAVQMRRDVQRGPLPRDSSPYAVDDALSQARITGRAFGVSTVFLIILVLLLVVATFYYAQYSGALRWLLFGSVVGVVGLLAVRIVRSSVRDPARLAARALAPAGVGGDLRALTTTLRRADGGLRYSQLLFDERLRKAFLEKVRVNRDLPAEAVNGSIEDAETLHGILGDRELTLFVLESARNARAYPTTMPALPKRPDFARRVAALLARMEAWR